MKETEKLGLRLPEDNDTADIAVLNRNFEALDAAMAGKADLDGTGKVPVEQLPNVAPTAHAASHAAGGTDPVTPGSIGAATTAELAGHTGRRDNPHGVTAAQIGAVTSAELGAHAGRRDNPHGIYPAQIGAAVTVTLTCTVPVAWAASGEFYWQNVSVPGMLASDNPVADILTGGDNAANKLYAEAWGKVLRIDTADNLVQIWCTEAPVTAFPVQFKVVR